jgi:hypothetical protein
MNDMHASPDLDDRLKPFDAVQAYDPDAETWFDGFIESEATIKTDDFWIVRLHDGPVQYGQKVTVLAVPYTRPDWIRGLEESARG